MNGLLTDFYELTMAAGYFEAGKAEEVATFELTIRRLPARRNYAIAAGIPQVVDYLLNLSFAAWSNSARLPRRFSTTSVGCASLAIFSRSPKARRCSPANPC